MATSELPIATYTIEYDRSLNQNIEVEVSDTHNGGVSQFTYNEADGKSSPERIILSVRSDSDIIGGWTNIGTLINYPSETGEGCIEVIDEEYVDTVEFNQQASEELNFTPVGGNCDVKFYGKILIVEKTGETSYKFTESEPLPTMVIGRTIKIQGLEAGQTIIGIADITYKVKTRLYGLEGGKEKVILGFQNRAGGTATTTITFEQEDVAYKNVVITVKDFCSGDILSGVAVTLNDDPLLSGITNASGEVEFPNLRKNQNYSIKMTRDGYMDSDKDELQNDSFTIE
jgi:hypothetical protein